MKEVPTIKIDPEVIADNFRQDMQDLIKEKKEILGLLASEVELEKAQSGNPRSQDDTASGHGCQRAQAMPALPARPPLCQRALLAMVVPERLRGVMGRAAVSRSMVTGCGAMLCTQTFSSHRCSGLSTGLSDIRGRTMK